MPASPRTTAPSSTERLLKEAAEAARKAYAPYSGIRVGAAVRSSSGKVYLGCNVENGSYGLSQCAERNAVATAVQAEGPSLRIEAVAVDATAPEPFPPCGACRQVLSEFASDCTVTYRAGAEVRHARLAELLPQAFRLEGRR